MGNSIQLTYTEVKEIPSIVEKLSLSYKNEATQSIPWRKEQLKQIWRMLDVGF
jgi:hypothetical protein